MPRATKDAPVKAAGKKAATARKSAKKPVLDKFLEGQLAELERERANYLRQAETLKAEADSLTEDREPGDVQFDEESGEGDTLAVERERDLALSAQARAAIEQIDTAIAKIHAGTYGQCENCGTSIPKERLKALPYAALCVKCKSGGLGLGR
jgi:RNA polymerase-binding transcription factor